MTKVFSVESAKKAGIAILVLFTVAACSDTSTMSFEKNKDWSDLSSLSTISDF